MFVRGVIEAVDFEDKMRSRMKKEDRDLISKQPGVALDEDHIAGVMGKFHWSRGQDERGHYIAYYDKWDLEIPDAQSGVGKILDRGQRKLARPFELYDRLYYDPKTFRPLPGQ